MRTPRYRTRTTPGSTFDLPTIAWGAARLLEPSLGEEGWTSTGTTITGPDGTAYEVSTDNRGRLTLDYDPAAHTRFALPPIEPGVPFVEPASGNRLRFMGLVPDHGPADTAAFAAHAVRVLRGSL
ncbi:hypothetical protein AB0D65_29785 [Streptomyces griseoloalbus]|uniref:Uncharacterized protein n=1 Tax=Streptomyces griseoloalbus TaxID=67303 RepID=A0ABV3EEM1_9ACTN